MIKTKIAVLTHPNLSANNPPIALPETMAIVKVIKRVIFVFQIKTAVKP